MFRLIGFLVLFSVTAGGYLFFDYRMASRWAANGSSDGLTFQAYLSGLPDRLANLSSGAASAAGLPSRLADMLPKPPEGWTVRPVEATDIDGFLPKNGKKADKAGVAAVKAMAEGDKGSGVEVAALTYEKGNRKLIVKAIRYPNLIFTGTASMQQRLELQARKADFRGTEFATVRGLDLTEDLLPEGFRGRMFLADVGAQIHLRILAPKRMADDDLLPFLNTLHVKAMNADVIDRVEGLGEVPVIVLASALEGDARDAYLAGVAARHDARNATLAAEQARLDAASPEAPSADAGFLASFFGVTEKADDAEAAAPAEKAIDCKTGKNGVKHCTVAATD